MYIIIYICIYIAIYIYIVIYSHIWSYMDIYIYIYGYICRIFYVYKLIYIYIYGGVSFVRVQKFKGGGPRVAKVVDGPWGPFRARPGQKWVHLEVQRPPPFSVQLGPRFGLMVCKGQSQWWKGYESVVKTDVCCTWRHPSLAKGHFRMKTIKKRRENEGPVHEPCIFTCRSRFWVSCLQIHRFLGRKQRLFYMHFYDVLRPA